jgi:uroporphyrin-III C-methyltransferase
MTVRAVRVLSEAEVVVHDGLVPAAILDLAPSSARRISVAKRKSRHTYAQDEINRLLVGLALEGLRVVRLKGGDPFIFGRGGEELEACRAAGVPCEVVPGVTAALAASASASVTPTTSSSRPTSLPQLPPIGKMGGGSGGPPPSPSNKSSSVASRAAPTTSVAARKPLGK